MSKTNFRRVMAPLSMLLVAGFLGVACGSDDGGGGGGGGGGALTADSFEQQVSEAFATSVCQSAYQCTEQQDPFSLVVTSRYGDQATCEANFFDDFLGAEGGLEFTSAVEQGIAEFNADKARECLDAVNALIADSCYSILDADDSPAAACDEVLTGLQPVGAACDTDEHCASGNCDFNADTGAACWGGECAEAEAGEEVMIAAEGESCDDFNAEVECDEGLICDTNDDMSASICVARDSRAEGEVCESTSVCASGLACLDGACGTLQLGAEGDACDFEGNFCDAGLVCVIDFSGGAPAGACAPPVQQGGDCFQDFDCAAGLQCDGADFTGPTAGSCESTLAEGEACESNLDCQTGLSCSDESGVCEMPQTCDVPAAG